MSSLLNAGIAVLALVVAATPAAPARSNPAPSAPGWYRVEGGPRTSCAFGKPFAFYVRAGDPHKVLLFLRGGGACWSGATCDSCGHATFEWDVPPLEGVERLTGLFDREDARNPARDFTAVFVPTCTGDIHLGDRTVTYSDSADACRPNPSFVVRHAGAADAGDAVAWMFAHLPGVRLALIAGESAGAISSPLYAGRVARHYPRARVVQIGDAAGGYLSRGPDPIFKVWAADQVLGREPGFDADSIGANSVGVYVGAAHAAPQVTFAQVNHVADAVQTRYLAMTGATAPLARVMEENLATLHRRVPRFHSYLAPGDGHGIIRGADFYTTAVNGVKLTDWVAALLEGRPMADVGVMPVTDTH
jgi:hypothetical protein